MVTELQNQNSSFMRNCIGCGNAFRAINKGKKYCSDLCYNTSYNNKMRNNQDHRIRMQDHGVNILRSLLRDNKSAVVSIETLDSAGFRFDLYSKRVMYSPTLNNYYAYYGPYQLNLTENLQIKITTENE